MNTKDTLSKLTVLAPYTLISGVLFSLLAILLCLAGIHDILKSMKELPARTVYALVMYGAFSLAMAMAGCTNFRAYFNLRNCKWL